MELPHSCTKPSNHYPVLGVRCIFQLKHEPVFLVVQPSVIMTLWSQAYSMLSLLDSPGFINKHQPHPDDIAAHSMNRTECRDLTFRRFATISVWLLNTDEIYQPINPGRCGSNHKSVICEHISRIKFMGTSCEIDFWWMPQKTTDYKSILVRVMAWCR